jgi:putative tryptophan/tyrosine transport system substrate-binding protein
VNAVRRRDFIKIIAGSAAAWPLAARAQQSDRVRRIGVLITLAEDDPQGQQQAQALLQSLQELGWKSGTNLEVDLRWGATNNERIQKMAKELVAEHPDVIQVTTTPGTAAVLRETRTISVVFSIVSDPVGGGFVASLPHPGGNATGFINIEASMGGKWVELLKEVAPDVSRVTLLFDPATGPQDAYYNGPIEAAARSLAIAVKPAPVGDVAAIKTEIAATAQERHMGLLVLPDIFTYTNRDLIVSLANGANLPAVYPFTVFASAGGLLSYGVDLLDLQRRAAGYVDRILKGTKPEDLPVQLPTKFELAVNLKTAKLLGLTIPPALLATADEVIE